MKRANLPSKLQINFTLQVSGGNDGAIVLTSVNLNQTAQCPVQSSQVISRHSTEEILTEKIPAITAQRCYHPKIHSEWLQMSDQKVRYVVRSVLFFSGGNIAF